MRLLLDANILLWTVVEEHKLGPRALELIRSTASVLFLSAATAWEISIKYALGNLPLHVEPEVFIPDVVRGLGMQTLDITTTHAVAAARLQRHHRDPFDRMLIAQAREEGLVLLTADHVFEKYDVEQIYCGR